MARLSNSLSTRSIKDLEKLGLHADGNGLYLRIGQGTAKSWVFVWHRNYKRHEMGLGSLLSVSLAMARERAQQARVHVAAGVNPRKPSVDPVPVDPAPKVTFGEVADKWMAVRKGKGKSIKSEQRWKRCLGEGGYQGVVFALAPTPDQVVLNLVEVYADPDFEAACTRHRDDIPGFALGIGKYGASQDEVVLEVQTLGTDKILSYGGYSSPIEDLACQAFGRPATPDELARIKSIMNTPGAQADAWWLSEGGSRNVLARLVPRLPAWIAKKAATAGDTGA